MANISHRIGNQKILYDAKNERFIKNEAANILLKCKERKQYKVPEKV
jgi:hypothetical protein